MTAPTPDYYEKELLGRAVAACDGLLSIRRFAGGYEVASPKASRPFPVAGPTLADALAALLRDLGEPPPERPSEAEVEVLRHAINMVGGDRVAYLRYVNSLRLACLLEGES